MSVYIRESHLSADFAAELCSTSKRTLQRKLAKHGAHFSELLDHVRFDTAARMLQHPELKVSDVSRLLGYSDPTHFSRSFRRVAGVTPKMFRQQRVRAAHRSRSPNR